MSVGGVGGGSGGGQMMGVMLELLQKGMEQQTEMAEKLIAVSLENSISADKMNLAQNIIDVYA